MIYFIKAGDFIKVGYTKSESSFKYRLSSYKTSCPFSVSVISKFDGGVDLEKDILNYFIEHHQKGEWFRYHKDIEDFALNPYPIPKTNIMKPLHENHKKLLEVLPEIFELYRTGASLRELESLYGIPRRRLTKYIPKDVRKQKDEMLKLKKRVISPNNKPVICVTTNEKFISVSEASRHFKTTVTNILRVCKGERKSWDKKIFRFLEKDLEYKE